MTRQAQSPRHEQKKLEQAFSPHERAHTAPPLRKYFLDSGLLKPEDAEKIEAIRRKKNISFAKAALSSGLIDRVALEYGLGVTHGFLHGDVARARIPADIHVGRNPYAKPATPYHQLRNRVLSRREAPKKILALGAVDKSVRSAVAAANLAASFSMMRKRILLVDLDTHRSPLAKMFGDPSAPGVLSCAHESNASDYIAGTMFVGVDLLPAGGNDDQNSRAGLAQLDLHKILDGLAPRYDYVLLNAPAAEAISDCELVWLAAQDVIALVRKNVSRLGDVDAFRQSVRAAGGDIYAALLIE